MTSANDALAAMGIDPTEAIAIEQSKTKKVARDNRVCICGHAVARHKTDPYSGLMECNPSRMHCPCQTIRPVLEVEDTRLFLRGTSGPKNEHALVRGMTALAMSGKDAKWIEQPKCDRCDTGEGPIVPVPITKTNRVAYEATPLNAMLCNNCLEEIR